MSNVTKKNEKSNDKYLPIGSVVLLKNTLKRVMIIGYLFRKNSLSDEFFDYCGCLYPEGICDTYHNILFNRSDINKVYFTGYEDVDEAVFNKRLVEYVKKGDFSTKPF